MHFKNFFRLFICLTVLNLTNNFCVAMNGPDDEEPATPQVSKALVPYNNSPLEPTFIVNPDVLRFLNSSDLRSFFTQRDDAKLNAGYNLSEDQFADIKSKYFRMLRLLRREEGAIIYPVASGSVKTTEPGLLRHLINVEKKAYLTKNRNVEDYVCESMNPSLIVGSGHIQADLQPYTTFNGVPFSVDYSSVTQPDIVGFFDEELVTRGSLANSRGCFSEVYFDNLDACKPTTLRAAFLMLRPGGTLKMVYRGIRTLNDEKPRQYSSEEFEKMRSHTDFYRDELTKYVLKNSEYSKKIAPEILRVFEVETVSPSTQNLAKCMLEIEVSNGKRLKNKYENQISLLEFLAQLGFVQAQIVKGLPPIRENGYSFIHLTAQKPILSGGEERILYPVSVSENKVRKIAKVLRDQYSTYQSHLIPFLKIVKSRIEILEIYKQTFEQHSLFGYYVTESKKSGAYKDFILENEDFINILTRASAIEITDLLKEYQQYSKEQTDLYHGLIMTLILENLKDNRSTKSFYETLEVMRQLSM
jgi:hypothetical protein